VGRYRVSAQNSWGAGAGLHTENPKAAVEFSPIDPKLRSAAGFTFPKVNRLSSPSATDQHMLPSGLATSSSGCAVRPTQALSRVTSSLARGARVHPCFLRYRLPLSLSRQFHKEPLCICFAIWRYAQHIYCYKNLMLRWKLAKRHSSILPHLSLQLL
jgi:hypothetical protein